MNEYESLSGREKEVLDLLVQGKSNKQIAMHLGVSNRTIEFHLSNIYSKLGVNSRAEAILFFMKDTSLKSEGVVKENHLRESTALPQNESPYNGGKSKILQRIPMKKRIFYIASLGALIILFVVFILLRSPDQALNNSQAASPPDTLTSETVAAITPTGQIPTGVDANTFTQSINSSLVSLTVKWFYIDQSRIYLDLVISGFPLPQDFVPIQIIDLQKIVIHRSDGSLVDLEHKIEYGGGGEGNPTNEEEPFFDEILDMGLPDSTFTNSQEAPYLLDIPVGGEITGENGEVRSLPLVTYHIEVKPSYIGQLTFATEKSAVMDNKIVTFKGMEINPSSAVVLFCVLDPEGSQWLPTVHILYNGNIISESGGMLINGDPSQEMCYRLNYTRSFQFDPADDPQADISILVAKLTKDQPERLPYELIASVQNDLAEQGIEFNYVVINHGSGIEITKKPTGMTETEALMIIQNALSEEAISSDVLIFDLN
ncbi:MAG: LuxR family transcriptional regulator [Anaerolineaceae bacterium]|jgi:DNA-binding CsgD family transcriptional regulator|nr:MAG: LuxR family transcriptional regulator [Anaerolineaceae bacterium]